MAAPTYTTDLADLSTAQNITGWAEPGTWTAGGTPTAETDYFINGNTCVAKAYNATGLGGLVFTAGAGVTIPTDGAFFCWTWFGAPNALNNQANGGIRLIIGSATTAFRAWTVGGSDTYTYGGWVCRVADPTVTPDFTIGSPTTTRLVFGWAVNNSNAVQRGNVFGTGVIRYGRGEARFANGDLANGYATFSGFATQNDQNTNRWGLLQRIDGGYLWQGLMVLGHSTAVDFRDSNTSILIANTAKVSSAFNRIEIRQAGSNVEWKAISITALGTVSKGQFAVIDNATVTLDDCVFTDMDTFVLQSNTSVTGCTFRRCAQITLGGATLEDSLITNSTAAASISATSLNTIQNCVFESDGSNHAVDLGTVSASTSMNWNNFATGYAGTNGTTGNETIRVNVASGQTLTINVGSGYTTPSIRNTGTGSVSVVSGQVTTTIAAIDATTLAPIQNARVYLVADAGGPLAEGTVIFNTLTDSAGEVTDIRSLASNQPVTGWVRKSSSAPYYKTSPIVATINNATGLSLTIQAIRDE